MTRLPMRQLDAEVLKEIMYYEDKEDYTNPRYMELLMNNYYTAHILRSPVSDWPEPLNRSFKHINHDVYVTMQGPLLSVSVPPMMNIPRSFGKFTIEEYWRNLCPGWICV